MNKIPPHKNEPDQMTYWYCSRYPGSHDQSHIPMMSISCCFWLPRGTLPTN